MLEQMTIDICFTLIKPHFVRLQIPFFEDVGSMTLQYLDSLFQQDNLAKSQFFKGLPKVLTNLPKVLEVLTCLPYFFKGTGYLLYLSKTNILTWFIQTLCIK